MTQFATPAAQTDPLHLQTTTLITALGRPRPHQLSHIAPQLSTKTHHLPDEVFLTTVSEGAVTPTLSTVVKA